VDRLRDDEQDAAEVLVSRLGGTICPKDAGGAQGTHDFDLVMADGHRIAVEVTSATDEDMERLRGESERRYPACELEADWNVWLPKDPALKLKPLLREVAEQLVVLERHGVDHVGRFVEAPEDPRAAEAARQISALRVDRVLRLAAPKEDEDACLVLALHGGAGSEPDALNALVADRAEAKRDVLTRAKGDARHLFVWVRQANAWMAMTDLPSPPPDAPELPLPIDVAWAATANPIASGKLYRLERGGAWEAL
jgi:hypothetical protein